MATQVLTNHHQHHNGHTHHHHVTFSGSNGGLRQVASPGPTTSVSANGLPMFGGFPISSVEHDNPFRPGSELIEEAENILKNVTIVGSQVTISGNDSGLGALSPPHQTDRSPANGSAPRALSPTGAGGVGSTNETQLQCSTILSTTSSTPGGQLRLTEDCVVRASPDSLRPESPPLRAEHVVVTKNGGVKSSPSSNLAGASSSAADADDASSKDKKKKKGGKKKCSIL